MGEEPHGGDTRDLGVNHFPPNGFPNEGLILDVEMSTGVKGDNLTVGCC